MRYAIAIALAASAVGILGAAANGAPDGVTRKATLKLTRSAPLTVRGSRFVPRERVRVSVSGSREATRRVTASAAGAFVVQFATFTFDRCNAGLSVVAVGSEGSRAGLKLPEMLCPPPL
jgi:hypothetical protein